MNSNVPSTNFSDSISTGNRARPIPLRAIDLYSGIGGWDLGFGLAGISVIESYEWWDCAVSTANHNLGIHVNNADIRKLAPEEMPSGIDIVAGSPPCTQFSFSNRGGRGDIDDGMKDIAKFFEIVDYVRPKFWVLENVPRLAHLLETAFCKGAPLARYAHLGDQMEIHVVNFADFGVPQSRKRCIAGCIPFKKLLSFEKAQPPINLGKVIIALSKEFVTDPIYGLQLPRGKVTEIETEPPLNDEELRLNRESKTHHPIYNDMSFPDRMTRPARTITATCTRVSRESVIIEDPAKPNCYRRLSVRERACLQGFPITYQFCADSPAAKMKMIGNAIPPIFAYHVGLAITGDDVNQESLTACSGNYRDILPLSATQTIRTNPGFKYPKNRSFRLAIKGLRFKSGTRFEFANHFVADNVQFRVDFYYSTSKFIREVNLNERLYTHLLEAFNRALDCSSLLTLLKELPRVDSGELQQTWNRQSTGEHPFAVIDSIAGTSSAVGMLLRKSVCEAVLDEILVAALDRFSAAREQNRMTPVYTSKLRKNRYFLAVGLLVGSAFNSINT